MSGAISKYKPEYDSMAEIACAEGGFTDRKLAKLFRVTETTINNWKREQPSFFESIKKGKDAFNIATAEDCLLKRIKGYNYTEITKERTETEDGVQMIEVKQVRKNVAPDTGAICFFLKNRDRERWPDRQAVDVSGGLKISHEDALKELDD